MVELHQDQSVRLHGSVSETHPVMFSKLAESRPCSCPHCSSSHSALKLHLVEPQKQSVLLQAEVMPKRKTPAEQCYR